MVESFRELKICNICGSDEYSVLYRWPNDYYSHDQYETCSWDGRQSIDLQIVKCNNCDLVYTNPSFKEEFLNLVYPSDIIPDSFEDKKLFRNKKWNEILNKISKYLKKGKTICDVGTRYGVLVKILSDKGYNSFGIEYNEGAIKVAKKYKILNIYQGIIRDLPEIVNKNNYFSVNAFVLDDVLEHLVDPIQDLKILNSLQQKGDYLFLKQMDLDSWGYNFFKSEWYYLQPAAHMFFFNVITISKLLSKTGYKIVEISRAPFYKHIKPLIKLILMPVLNSNLMKKTTFNNKKLLYLTKRKKLSDMFLVVAQKI